MPKARTAIHAGSIMVKDPETQADIDLEVVKDPVSGAMFAVDASFIEQVEESVNSPFGRYRLQMPE